MTGVIPIQDASAVSSNTDCTICMEPLSSDVVKMVACDHHFHAVCILAWFEKNAPRQGKKKGTCPNCRHELYEPDPRPSQQGGPLSGTDQVESPLPTATPALWFIQPASPLPREPQFAQAVSPLPRAQATESVQTESPHPAASRSAPRFHAGSIRDSLEIMDERARWRLESIVRTGAVDAGNRPENGHADGVRSSPLAEDEPDLLEDDHPDEIEQPSHLHVITSHEDTSSMSQHIWTVPQYPPRHVASLGREDHRAEQIANQINLPAPESGADVQQAADQLTALRLQTLRAQNRPASRNDICQEGDLEEVSQRPATASPLSYLALRRELERSLERSGLTAEQLIGVWRRQGPLANDPLSRLSGVPVLSSPLVQQHVHPHVQESRASSPLPRNAPFRIRTPPPCVGRDLQF